MRNLKKKVFFFAALFIIFPSVNADGDAGAMFSPAKPEIRSNVVAVPDRIGQPPGAEYSTVFFDFDSDRVRSDDYLVIEAHAKYLLENPVVLHISAHTDEVGDSEYNARLAHRRAQSVSMAVQSYGVPASQIEIHVHGEEKPQKVGHVQEAYNINRRVEFSYKLTSSLP